MNRFLALALAVALGTAACGDGDEAAQQGPGADVTEDAADAADEATDGPGYGVAGDDEAGADDAAAAAVAAADSELGTILVDGAGMTLYLFDNDAEGESACYDECAANWPPLVADGEPAAGDGVDPALLGTTERDDGAMQVTYAGNPLYHYAADGEPGDVSGQTVGGVWWVVDPDGQALRDGS